MNYVASGYVRSGRFRRDGDTVGPYTFDKYGKFIFVSESVSGIDLADIWSRFVDWFAAEDNMKIRPAMKYTGFDVIPTGFTGATFFMINGWRCIYNPNTTAISGVLYSEDFATGYWDTDYNPIYPVTVSAVVNTVSVGSGVTAQDKIDIVSGVWNNVTRTLTEAGLDEASLHDALDSYANKSEYKSTPPTAQEIAIAVLDADAGCP